jgi:uncharacterized protein (DUF362 family)
MTIQNTSAWIGAVRPTPQGVQIGIETGLSKMRRLPAAGERWAVKLNLTYPRFLPGVVNSPVFVEGLCRFACDRQIRLILVEGDGGNGAFSAEDAFRGIGISSIAEQYGMMCVSLSEKPWEWRETEVLGRGVRLPYSPFFGRRDFDRFITTPLFKNHVFTTVTLGMKNLWGCIPDAYRMYYHHLLDAGIVALCKELRPDFSIFDGLIGLRGRGPMDGKPVEMNALMVGGSVGAGEAAALEVMGISLECVRHLVMARAEGLVPPPKQVSWLTDPGPFARADFVVDKSWWNRVSLWIANYPFLQRFIYHSPLSTGMYILLDRFRRGSAQADLTRARRAGEYTSIPVTRRGIEPANDANSVRGPRV